MGFMELKKLIFSLLLAVVPASAAYAEDVEVDTATFSYALARVGLEAGGASAYEVKAASFYGRQFVQGQTGRLFTDIAVNDGMDSQAATAAISDKYGNIRLLCSGEGAGDIPDEIMPTLTPDDSGRLLYVLSASASRQYGVKTRGEAVYKALLAPLYCEDTGILYFITLFYPFEAFEYKNAVAELNSFSCSEPIEPDKKELESKKGPQAKPAAAPAPAAAAADKDDGGKDEDGN